MGITEKIGDKLRRKKSKVFEPQAEISTSYHPPMPKQVPPYPSSIRPTSVLEPQFPINRKPIEIQGDKASPWHPDGFAVLIQQQKREEEELRRQNERKRMEEATVRYAAQENQSIEEKRRKAAAEEQRLKRMYNASAEGVRHLRGLIREKYRLDIYVWNKRKVQRANRKLIMKDCLKADGILRDIYSIVNTWDQNCFDPEDWKVAKKIKEGLGNQQDHILWADLPPWERRDGRVNGQH